MKLTCLQDTTGQWQRRESVGFKITRRRSDNTRHHTLQQYTVGEGSSIAHAMWSHMSTVSDDRELFQGV